MDKPFKTIDQQMEILRDRNLGFLDEKRCKNYLQQYGYYSIINGYKDMFLSLDDDRETFHHDIFFEHIFALHQYDQILRNNVFNAMLEIEDNLRSAVSYVLGEEYGAKESGYLKKENFDPGKRYENHDGSVNFERDYLFSAFERILSSKIHPMKHYRENHGNIPPWILMKGLHFGDLICLARLMPSKLKNQTISIMYGLPRHVIEEDGRTYKHTFFDSLMIFKDFRNRAAHGGRTYNYETKNKLRFTKHIHKDILGLSLTDFKQGQGRTGIFALYGCAEMLANKKASEAIMHNITRPLSKFISMLPTYKETLLGQMNIPIDFFDECVRKER